jgi:hypothetical protein
MAGKTKQRRLVASSFVGLLSVPGVDGGGLVVSGAALRLISGY